MENLQEILENKTFIIIWFAVFSVVAAALTMFDKYSAMLKGRRISEKTLFLVAATGGAAVMFITMKAISHKTRHKRFMIGLPVIILIHCILIWYFYIGF